ncbi:MAG: ester cyclase [Ginsengibacter sp.]
MTNEYLLREFMQKVWNEKHFDSIPKYVAPAYTIHIDTSDAWEGKTLNHEEFAKRLDFTFNSFPDINFQILTAISDGDYVAITWIMTGLNSGKIAGFPPTGKSINTKGATIYHFKEGKVSGHSQVFDRTTIMKQLGFIK